MPTYTVTIYRWVGDDDTGHEETLEVTGDVTPLRRGRYSGPAHLCYPDEGGEVELTRVVRFPPWDDRRRPAPPPEELDPETLSADERETAEQKLYEMAVTDDSGPEYSWDD